MSRKKAAQAAPETRDEEVVEQTDQAPAAAAGSDGEAGAAAEGAGDGAGVQPAVSGDANSDLAGGAQPAPVLKVRTRNRKPFRRAGIAFGADWTELPLGQLTADQAAAIEAETMLEVVRN